MFSESFKFFVHPNQPPRMYSSAGFSLIELMIAISIVAIVSALGITSINTIQKNSRDTQRQADLRTIQSALQQYYADQNRYPSTLDSELTDGTAFTDCSGKASPCTATKTYISKMPKDPLGGEYFYRPVVDVTRLDDNCDLDSEGEVGICHYYVLCTALENPPSGSSCYNGTYNFQVTPL